MTNKKTIMYLVILAVLATSALISEFTGYPAIVGCLLLYITILNDFNSKILDMEIKNLREEIKNKDDLINIQKDYIDILKIEENFSNHINSLGRKEKDED